MVAIVDYDAGNIKSVEKALQYIGEHPVITRDVKEIKKADHVIVVHRLWASALGYSCFLSEVMSQNMM